MRIAIAMCTYNGQAYLAKQLDSFLSQTRLPDQIVICDDRSTDDSVLICQAFADRACSMGVEVSVQVNAENLGYVRNFERALGLCKADLLFLSDQDDVWHREKIARFQARFAAEPDLLLLHTDARLVDAAGDSLGCGLLESQEVTAAEIALIHAGKARAVFVRRNLVTGATAAFRASLLELALPIRPGWIHDEWLGVVGALIGRVDCMEWEGIDYRQHGRNQIGARKRSVQEKISGAGVGPRRAFLAKSAARMQALLVWLSETGQGDAQLLQDVRSAVSHLQFRAAIAGSFSHRLIPVIKEVVRGNCHRHGSGLRSIVADLAGLS